MGLKDGIGGPELGPVDVFDRFHFHFGFRHDWTSSAFATFVERRSEPECGVDLEIAQDEWISGHQTAVAMSFLSNGNPPGSLVYLLSDHEIDSLIVGPPLSSFHRPSKSSSTVRGTNGLVSGFALPLQTV